MDRLEIIKGDITKLKFDAIVNSANKSLLRGGGVDGAIHRAAGRGLEEECKELNGCPTGEARITKSYDLIENHVYWIIHAVGPRWLGGNYNEEKLLEDAYKNSLELAINYKDIYLQQCDKILDTYINGVEEAKRDELRQEVMENAETYIKKHQIKTIAFPSISTGIYHFPLDKASDIALRTIEDFLKSNSTIEKVAIVCLDEKIYKAYINKN
ncbi:Appr-1-p processing protein [Clostridium bovifaecis]|uniref:Appr-1-p processing protein n=1 Tax=Clostridium bovifaecis TaxID=2184719 RepID=A0A6I6EQX5_9CLOT|nr:Appr-1-p processing protein [Clostridium bovifaecis]